MKKFILLVLILLSSNYLIQAQKKGDFIVINNFFPTLSISKSNERVNNISKIYKFNLGISNWRMKMFGKAYFTNWIKGEINISPDHVVIYTMNKNNNDTLATKFTSGDSNKITTFWERSINFDTLQKYGNTNSVSLKKIQCLVTWDEFFYFKSQKIYIIRINSLGMYLYRGIHDGFAILYNLRKGIIGTYNYYSPRVYEKAWSFIGSGSLLKFMSKRRFTYRGIALNFL